jgi:lipopolysaccharide export system permease protein
MLLATLLAAFLIYFSNDVLPDANYKARSLFLDIRMQRPGFDLQENVFYDGIEGYSFLVRRIPPASDSLYDVSLFREARNDIPEAVIKAEKGKLGTVPDSDILQLTLSNGSVIRSLSSVHARNPRYERSDFSEYRVFFDVSDLSFSRSDPERRRRDDRTMGSAMMLSIVDSLQQSTERERIELLRSHGISQAVEEQLFSTFPALPDAVQAPAKSQELPSQNTLAVTDPSAAATTEESFSTAADTTASPADSSLAASPPQVSTGLIALDRLASREQQLAVADRSLISLRNAASGLSSLENTRQWRAERSAQYMVEVHKKIAIPVGCIIFVLVGAPLGILTRKGNLGFNALISAVLFTYYWITIIQGEKLADRMVISPFTGMWFGNATLLLLGLYLTAKVMYEFRFSDLWRSARDASPAPAGREGVRA